MKASADSLVSALPGAALDGSATSQQRYQLWRRTQELRPEHLVPMMRRAISPEWPRFMERRPSRAAVSDAEVQVRAESLGPWHVPFRIGDDLWTMDMQDIVAQVRAHRLLFRRELICGAVAELLGDDLDASTILDLGCNSGFFSLEMADRGARQVDGIDLRPENIAQARFLADLYGIDNVSFEAADAATLPAGKQWDVVFDLGVLYHVIDPLQHLRRTYERCRRFAVIDTICHLEPISAFILFGDKDIGEPAEGREEWELHPTYRGAIEAIRYAGFSDVIEVVGHAERPHELYESGMRRCFVAIK